VKVNVTQSLTFENGMVIGALVASRTPAAIAATGPTGIVGRTYKDIVQDMVDAYASCVVRDATGGGWSFDCPNATTPDNSVLAAPRGIIAGESGFGVQVDPNLRAWNQQWLTFSQTGTGAFGDAIWGTFVATPTGMLQLVMDDIGRGDARWDKAETFLRDNFANLPGNSATSIKSTYYGLFASTEAMLLHDPQGVLQPIQFLRSATPGVPPLDWYAAEVSSGAPTDGVARFLVSQQNSAGVGGAFWFNTREPDPNLSPFDTALALLMLHTSPCVANLSGRGTPSGLNSARVDLTWSALTGANFYTVLRGSTIGGPYNVLGTSTRNAYSDHAGLANGHSYVYVIQPDNTEGLLCQSNEAKVIVPNR